MGDILLYPISSTVPCVLSPPSSLLMRMLYYCMFIWSVFIRSRWGTYNCVLSLPLFLVCYLLYSSLLFIRSVFIRSIIFSTVPCWCECCIIACLSEAYLSTVSCWWECYIIACLSEAYFSEVDDRHITVSYPFHFSLYVISYTVPWWWECYIIACLSEAYLSEVDGRHITVFYPLYFSLCVISSTVPC